MINFTVPGESSNRCRTEAAQIHLHVVSPPAQIKTSQPNRISFATASICRLAAGGKTPDIVAPFELRGAHTRDLNAIMPGRTKSPVQQACTKPVDFVLLMAKIQGCVARQDDGAGILKVLFPPWRLGFVVNRYEIAGFTASLNDSFRP